MLARIARASHVPYGYARFCVRIDPFLQVGADNEVRVECRNGDDSRWYTGGGIYRDVHLCVQEQLNIVPDSLRVTTLDRDETSATVEVRAVVRNDGLQTRTLRFVGEVLDPSGDAVERDDVPVTVPGGETVCVRQRLYIANPALWDVDSPNLYRLRVGLNDDGHAVDVARTHFGIRTIQLDPRRGLRVNGRPVKLRGGCVHHDNGIIAAAAIARAGERRIELLKRAGFNAIRSAHNPIGTAMLDACDRLGMLVMDETFDQWTSSKQKDDYASDFSRNWEADIEAISLATTTIPASSCTRSATRSRRPGGHTALFSVASWRTRYARSIRRGL